MPALLPRNRWLAAAAAALLVHGLFGLLRFWGGEPLAVQERVEGTPAPAYMHLELVATLDTGAPIAKATSYAPSASPHDDDATMDPPQKPDMGLWVIAVPLSFQRRSELAAAKDAGPQ